MIIAVSSLNPHSVKDLGKQQEFCVYWRRGTGLITCSNHTRFVRLALERVLIAELCSIDRSR